MKGGQNKEKEVDGFRTVLDAMILGVEDSQSRQKTSRQNENALFILPNGDHYPDLI